jgi:hypothetical protein
VYGLARPLLEGVPAPVRGVLVGLAANLATTGPMAAAGVTEVREWTTDSWVSDLVPHIAYGLATAAVADALTRR